MNTTMHSDSDRAATSPVTFRGPDEGDAVWFLDNLITVKASARDGASYGLVESVLPQGSEAPLHRHLDEDEAFYILEGVLTLFIEGGREIEARPGAFVHIPRGVAHGFRARTPVKMLVVCAPKGFCEFIRDFGIEAPRRELPPVVAPDEARLGAIAAKHRVELVGPLPA